MKRIAKTVFPGKLARTGNTKYISVPTTVIERMGLKEGDYLDVTITWPEMQEYDIDDTEMPEPKEEKPKRGRRTKIED
ncbi:MAG: hypothetical protein A3Q59_04105 [Methanomethylophilus alvi]|nr:MAG: hypothetical protein A3Q59_04105 [Methanomethylophilus alvi]